MLARWSVLALLALSAWAAASAQRQPGTFTFSHTTEQTLLDGTHIKRVTHTTTIRDSAGRTRSENESQIPGRAVIRSVNIMDPVAGVSYSYQGGEGDSSPHTYTRVEMHPKEQAGVPQGAMLSMLASPPPPPPPSSAVVIKPPMSGMGFVAGGVMSGGPETGALGVTTAQMRPDIKSEDLGFDTVAGVSCKSRRTTRVFPTGFYGNDRPITVTREDCIAVGNGGMMVRNVTDDPRTGTQTMLLESASFTEPAETLFQPPAGYTENTPNRPH